MKETSMLVRPASKAGSWYPARAEELERTVNALAAAAPVAAGAASLLAGVVPHAGLCFSGETAARVFALLRQTCPDVNTVIILGAVHTVWLDRPAAWAGGAWDCPGGAVKVDGELAGDIVHAGLADDNPAPHYGDNAIELQLPFIRFLFPEAMIVPIAVPPLPESVIFGEKLAEITARAEKSGKKTAVIASTDLTHYGAVYNFAPAGCGEKALEWAKANDRRILDMACRKDAEKIVPEAARAHNACGAGALAAVTAYARARGTEDGQILQQTTSFDVMPEGVPEMFVGYGALAFPAERTENHGKPFCRARNRPGDL